MTSSLPDRLEALIAQEHLAPGMRLPAERVLAERLGVSRPRLREAIHGLAARGRLVARRGAGTFLAAPVSLVETLRPFADIAAQDPGYWRDVLEIRKSLEPDAAFHAASRATLSDRVRLEAACACAAETAPPDVQAQADAHFHMAVAEASHNAVLRHMMAGLFDLLRQSISTSLDRLYDLPRTREALDVQHHAIAQAILAARPEEARARAFEHLDFVEDSLRRIEEAAERRRRAARAFAPAGADLLAAEPAGPEDTLKPRARAQSQTDRIPEKDLP